MRGWFDVHAHPGQLHVSAGGSHHPAIGAQRREYAAAEFSAAGLAAVSFSTVSDSLLLGVRADGNLGSLRSFEAGEAYAEHKRQLSAMTAYSEAAGMPIMRSADDVDAAREDGRTRMMLSCEGAHFVEHEWERLDEAHEIGVRTICLVHYHQNEYGDVQTAPPAHGGLTDAGARLVREMNRLGLLIDLAHATHQTTMDVLRRSSDPVMISHTHLDRARREHPRLVSREHARAVAEAGGLVGAWPSGFSSESLADFVGEIARLVDAVGVDHVGVGTDMDGNYRPVLSEYEQFQEVASSLAAMGFASDEVDAILGGNAIALIRRVCD
ncbi:MAG TPA: membrane dipeptidase [Jatrophihabitantaceae bacterium]|nr:membrane dipeptidase [Jatrophihabitantaceae bacterium]